MKTMWWKLLSMCLLLYSVIGGLLGKIPLMPINRESTRSLYYHLPMWFTMMFLFVMSCIYSIMYLNSRKPKYDMLAGKYASVGVFFGILGFATGMVWATFTWGAPWSNDPKQIGTALSLLSYMAYLVLRSNIKNNDKLGNVAAVYNIFAFAIMIPLIYILPDVTGDSSHPGAGQNVGFGQMDSLDGAMRRILYPATIGWILLGLWWVQIQTKIAELKNRLENI